MTVAPNGKKLRVFLDANILFSAADVFGRTSEILKMLVELNHEAVTNTHAWEEVLRNINAKRPQALAGLHKIRWQLEILETQTPLLDVVCAEKDIPILAGAIDAQCTHLWTGDKAHLGQFYGRRIQGVMVVSASMMYELLVRAHE